MNSSLHQEGLEEKIERLEKENEYLKSLLEKHQIEFDPLPFIHDEKITEVHVRFFLFHVSWKKRCVRKAVWKAEFKDREGWLLPAMRKFLERWVLSAQTWNVDFMPEMR
ncbi:hypothetical protein [uncultured Dubosiella sp.]|uniref:hypothetical protein n=1 Tax=uncultured Dubosiella sp. TaxID=1937011 RepID=UPI0025B472B9|nr:hypothetical protein [uncultured Dubosiella sp.]